MPRAASGWGGERVQRKHSNGAAEKDANKFLLEVIIFFTGGERGLLNVRRQRCGRDMMVAEAPIVKMVRPTTSVSHPVVLSLSPQGSAMRLQRLEGN